MNLSKRKEFLIRKNTGRLELDTLSQSLKNSGIYNIQLLNLNDSDRVIASMIK